MEQKLLPCPFCGRKANLFLADKPHFYDIKCDTEECYMQHGADWLDYKENVVKKWNTRKASEGEAVELLREGARIWYDDDLHRLDGWRDKVTDFIATRPTAPACKVCGGTGHVYKNVTHPMVACPTCNGTGTAPKEGE